MDYARSSSPNKTPQSEKARDDQKLNDAGGYVFETSLEQQVRRFLITGTEGGTYYVNERDATKRSFRALKKLIDEDPQAVLEQITEVSLQGLAASQEPLLFAFALLLDTREIPKEILKLTFQRIVRTGTHLFYFVSQLKGLRGWGRRARDIVKSWYEDKKVESLSYQCEKYKQRHGFTHRDLLRLSHPKALSPLRKKFFDYLCDREVFMEDLPPTSKGAFLARRPNADIAALIKEYRLPRECVDTEHLKRIEVWKALLVDMPLGALVRNLGKMTSIGLLKQSNDEVRFVKDRLTDPIIILKSRIHPIQVLKALVVYAEGKGFKGSLEWTPERLILDALEKCFFMSCKNVKATGKRICLALDVSSSMTMGDENLFLKPADITTAMALATYRTEPLAEVMCFSTDFEPLGWPSGIGLQAARDSMWNHAFGGTDCSLPMQWALEQKRLFDAFVIYTDNETWHGGIHPFEALEHYRRRFNPYARLIVCATDSSEFSIADPKDPLSIDICGFDASTPKLINEFIEGKF